MHTTIHNALQRRYATKAFDPNFTLSEQNIQMLQQSLILTPSSYGLQPWKFLFVTNKEKKQQLVAQCYNQKQVVDCAALVVLCRNNNLTHNDVDRYIDSIATTRSIETASLTWFADMMKQTLDGMSIEQRRIRADKQVYIALWFLLETAALLNIDTCPMEWFIGAWVVDILKIDTNKVYPTVLCALWKRSDNDPYKDLPKVRFPLNDLIEVIK